MFLFDLNWQEELRRRMWENPAWSALVSSVLEESAYQVSSPLTVEREAGRHVLLPMARGLARRAQVGVLAQALTGRSICVRSVLRDALIVAELPDWNPSHFLDTAEFTSAMGCALCWTATVADSTQQAQLIHALEEKGLRRGLASMKRTNGWGQNSGNWNIVCNAALLVGATALKFARVGSAALANCKTAGNGSSELAEAVLYAARRSMQVGLAGVGPSGEWSEGVTYRDYAVGHAWLAQRALRHLSCHDSESARFGAALARLIDGSRFRAAMIGGSKQAADFGDGLPDVPPPAVGPPGIVPPERAQPLHLIWGGGAVLPPACLERFIGNTYGSLRRRGPEGEIGYLAIRAGRVEGLHAHCDLASLIWEYRGCRIIADPGRGDYTAAGYFDPARRFSQSQVQESDHSTLCLADAPQSRGLFAKLGALEEDGLRADITDATGAALWSREVRLTPEGGLQICDRLETDVDLGALSWTLRIQHGARPFRLTGAFPKDESTDADISRGLRRFILRPSHAEARAGIQVQLFSN